MNAQLKPITARCAEKPAYDNTPTIFGTWYVTNEVALRAYYVAIGGRLADLSRDNTVVADGRNHKFMAFAQVQWDIARRRF